jgi:ribosomal protein S18 acetylase RimI-like enzyme
MRIRDVQPSDVRAVRHVLVETWHATYDLILGAERVTEITESWHSQANLLRQIGLSDSAFLLAETTLEGIIATSFSRRLENGSVMLARLYVIPFAQRRGAGKALLNESIARFPQARSFQVEVEPQNRSAVQFYQHNGFRELSRVGNCGGRHDLTSILMERVPDV